MNNRYLQSRLQTRYLYNFLFVLGIIGLCLNFTSNYKSNNDSLRTPLYSNEAKYNYYMLAVQKWCTYDYQIHGLWPQYDENSYPSNCENVKYVEPTGELLDEMNENWSSCPPNSNLWQHEWQKHGSCVEKQIGSDENAYFKMALDLFQKNKDKLVNCSGKDCTLGCFDLEGNYIVCP